MQCLYLYKCNIRSFEQVKIKAISLISLAYTDIPQILSQNVTFIFRGYFVCFQGFKRQIEEMIDYGDTKVILFNQLVAHECFFPRVFVDLFCGFIYVVDLYVCMWIYLATIEKKLKYKLKEWERQRLHNKIFS